LAQRQDGNQLQWSTIARLRNDNGSVMLNKNLVKWQTKKNN